MFERFILQKRNRELKFDAAIYWQQEKTKITLNVFNVLDRYLHNARMKTGCLMVRSDGGLATANCHQHIAGKPKYLVIFALSIISCF